MLFSSSRGQISSIFFVVVLIFTVGILLYTFSPTINDLRVSQINNFTDDTPILERFIFYALMPGIWLLWILLSLFAVVYTVESARGVL